MGKPLLRTDKEITEIYERQKNTIYRVCFSFLKNKADTEDAVQETFFRLITKSHAFESMDHEKAWLIRTATNVCKDTLRNWWRKRENLDDYENIHSYETVENDNVIDAIMNLREKYKTVVYLYYYEGFNSVEIAKILNKPQSTIRNYLHEARNILREKIGGEINEE